MEIEEALSVLKKDYQKMRPIQESPFVLDPNIDYARREKLCMLADTVIGLSLGAAVSIQHNELRVGQFIFIFLAGTIGVMTVRKVFVEPFVDALLGVDKSDN